MARIMKRDAERLLGNVPEEYVFYLRDGHILRNIRELGEALKNMSDETFYYHSNQEKKDFSNWVRDVIKDEKLARDLAKSENRLQAARRIAERDAFLSKKLA